MDLPLFRFYASLFREHGHLLYLIGGTSRDLLLGRCPEDFDFVTDATPSEEKAFLLRADFSFGKFGSVKIKEGKDEIDITTFRQEGGYSDSRHPDWVNFVSSPEEDSWRRDFTINALYMDDEGRVLDFHHGLDDLREGVLRFIGDPFLRVKEDPLRILRAERFAKRLGFRIEPKSQEAIDENRALLSKLNPDKVKIESEKR